MTVSWRSAKGLPTGEVGTCVSFVDVMFVSITRRFTTLITNSQDTNRGTLSEEAKRGN